jgi:para-nitrobenzyl esterase
MQMLSEAESEAGAIDRRSFFGLTLAAGVAAAAGAAGPVLAQDAGRGQRRRSSGASPVVETSAGRVQGLTTDDVHVFKGIPYGASTAGENRFQPPRKATPWTGVKDATKLGLRCPVHQSTAQAEYVVLDPREPAGEDCLCLNVWTAGLDDGRKRPVMVWLHGGGFSGGSAGPVLYDGTRLASRRDVVVVGVNHRLNLWGYLQLGLTGLSRFEQTSNVGMLDIVASLEWVRDNIERFGGDPANVTIFGQSGGGSKVSTLLGMPAAKGLFHRAIVESGSQVRSMEDEQAMRTVEQFLAVFDLKPNEAEKLLQIPYYDLRAGLERGEFRWAPLMDRRTLPAHNFDPVATPISADVPLIIGSNETESTWNVQQHYDPLDDETLQVFVQRLFKGDAAKARKVISVYKSGRPKASNLDLYLILASDLSGFRTGTDTMAERKSALGKAPVYKYYFDWYSPVAGGILRAMHIMDVPFVFDNVDVSRSLVGYGPELQGIADRVSSAWTNFARTGDPNGPGVPKWEPFDSGRRATMFIDADMRQVEDPYREERLARLG